MVLIDGGDFIMGSDRAERDSAYARSSAALQAARWFEGELARHTRALRPFCIDRTLVTQTAYARFVRAAGHRRPFISKRDYERQGFLVHDYDREVTRYLWRSSDPPQALGDHPVVLVSADDAEAYCHWRGARLPIEAEWEKASRGADGRLFPWGNDWDSRRLNIASAFGATTTVDRFVSGASQYGMLDAAGNVFQWTGSSLPDRRRLLKGCAWDDEIALCRPAFRHGRPPSSRHILIGFRCAASSRP